jgi:hypothetical protein
MVLTVVTKTFVFRYTLVTNVIKWQYHYLHGGLDLKMLRIMTVGTAYREDGSEHNIF